MSEDVSKYVVSESDKDTALKCLKAAKDDLEVLLNARGVRLTVEYDEIFLEKDGVKMIL